MMRGFEEVGIFILAAGSSRRMHDPKLTIPFAGSTLLDRIISTSVATTASSVHVVTGANRDRALAVMGAYPRVVEVHNERWKQGQSTSVIAATLESRYQGLGGALIVLADQPFVQARHLDALLEAFRCGSAQEKAYVSRVGSRDGNPCLFAAEAYLDLFGLRGDEGARKLYRSWPEEQVGYVCFDERHLFHDVDTRDDFRYAEEQLCRTERTRESV